MMQRILIGIFLCGCSTTQVGTINKKSLAPKVKKSSEMHLGATRYTLPNGLRLIVAPNGHLPIVSYFTFYNVGPTFEKKGLTGLSHFLEHLMFKGTQEHPHGKFFGVIEGSGGSTNAYTSRDQTVYYQDIPSEVLEDIIDLEADRMKNLSFGDKEFNKERQVVLEERKLRYENSPHGQLSYALMEKIFQKTPYQTSIIGEKEDLIRTTTQDVLDFYKRYYAPNNAVVVIVGDVDPQDAYEMIKDHYGNIEKSKNIEVRPPVDKNPYKLQRWGKDLHLRGASKNVLFALAFPGKYLGDKDYEAYNLLAQLLGDGKSSYFYQRYVNGRTPLMSSISVSHSGMAHQGFFSISGELVKAMGHKRLKKKLIKDFRRACREKITRREIEKFKNKFMIGWYSLLSTNHAVASLLGSSESFYGDFEYYKKSLKNYQSLTYEDIFKVCSKLVDQQNVLVTVWSKNPRRKK